LGLVKQKGLAGVTMGEIAKEAGWQPVRSTFILRIRKNSSIIFSSIAAKKR
jgi:hypothetical protein